MGVMSTEIQYEVDYLPVVAMSGRRPKKTKMARGCNAEGIVTNIRIGLPYAYYCSRGLEIIRLLYCTSNSEAGSIAYV
jgi:ligand-binding sensor protein